MSSLNAKCAARTTAKSEELVSRAANFRIEADALRARALSAVDDLIRDEYLFLADRWSLCAAHLEAEAVVRFLEAP